MITYKKGDVTKAKDGDLRLIPHIVNSAGIWGSGVVVALEKTFPGSMIAYENWANDGKVWCPIRKEYIPFELGEVIFYNAGQNTYICHMVAQKSPGHYKKLMGQNIPPIRIEALKECMMSVSDVTNYFLKSIDNTVICAPKFGSLRAGGNFELDILPLIKEVWKSFNIVIFEYQEK